DAIIDLVRRGEVRPVVGSTPSFEDLPSALAAIADRATVGRVIVLVD
ncbi:MAG: zinc-binding dehydrogenase, partial [Acidobacteria bacterium]|nr:zinc-binding dehydrogenase [Acidobacteriota bacterium]